MVGPLECNICGEELLSGCSRALEDLSSAEAIRTDGFRALDSKMDVSVASKWTALGPALAQVSELCAASVTTNPLYGDHAAVESVAADLLQALDDPECRRPFPRVPASRGPGPFDPVLEAIHQRVTTFIAVVDHIHSDHDSGRPQQQRDHRWYALFTWMTVRFGQEAIHAIRDDLAVVETEIHAGLDPLSFDDVVYAIANHPFPQSRSSLPSSSEFGKEQAQNFFALWPTTTAPVNPWHKLDDIDQWRPLSHAVHVHARRASTMLHTLNRLCRHVLRDRDYL